MSSIPDSDLATVAQLILDLELKKLSVAAEDVARGKARIEKLDRLREARTTQLEGGGSDLAFTTGRDALWAEWLTAEQTRLSGEVARAAARREAQRHAAILAFGKVAALKQIHEFETAKQKAWRLRREIAEGRGG